MEGEGEGSGIEIEVKLRGGSAEEVLARLSKLPAKLAEGRRFEDNDVYDTADGRLQRTGSLLRLRVVERRGLITFKDKVETDLHAKVRAEVQTSVASPQAVRKIFTKLELVRVYRYQKYRSHYGWSDPVTGAALAISLDETPIGVFVELEGPKDSIDRAAARMGYAEEEYILDDYRSLHEAWLEERGLPSGDMLFPDRGIEGPPR